MEGMAGMAGTYRPGSALSPDAPQDSITGKAQRILNMTRITEDASAAIYSRMSKPVPANTSNAGLATAEPSHLVFILEEIEQRMQRIGANLNAISNTL